jgi:ParB family chromosome partitioning protein
MASGEAKKLEDVVREEANLPVYARFTSVAPSHAGRSVNVDRIIVGDRLRPTDAAAVEAKRVSMRESGQISPIMVRPAEGQPGWFVLVVGAHRLNAAKLEGWAEIKADVRDLSDAQARLIEIDENLISKGLTAYERAIFVNARLQTWAEIHPDRVDKGNSVNLTELAPKRGRPANSDKMSQFLGDTPATMGFSTETAADLGFSETLVKRALAVARGLSPAAHAKISGSALGKNEGLLRQIAGVADKAEQLRVVEALSDGRATKFTDALVIAAGGTPSAAVPTPVDETVKAFRTLWGKATPSARAAILHDLAGKSLPGGWKITAVADV